MPNAVSPTQINRITSTIIDAAIRIHRAIGPDLIVEGLVIVEVKALNGLALIHRRQLLTYLRIANCPLGLLLDFGGETMKAGIKRVINGYQAQ